MGKVKVCGFTNLEDFLLAERLGADYAGFIFYPGSRRRIEPEKARAMIAAGSGRMIPVGVFVDEAAEHVRQIVEYTGIAVVQLHGEEQPDVCDRLPVPCWKTFKPRDDSFLQRLAAYSCQAYLLDSWSAVSPGGTGKPFAWQWAERAIATGKAIVVAGGVSSANIDALLGLKPFAVDICSALEKAPGEKSRAKMERFFAKIKAAARRNG
jgi:phosphoribosylanthranilate isomerase